MSACSLCNEPLHSCVCDALDQPWPTHPKYKFTTTDRDMQEDAARNHPECGEPTREDWNQTLANLNNKYRLASEGEVSGEGVTYGLRRGNLSMLYGRSGGKSVAGELMLLIEIARAAYRHRLTPMGGIEIEENTRRLDSLLRQFAKLDEPKPHVL